MDQNPVRIRQHFNNCNFFVAFPPHGSLSVHSNQTFISDLIDAPPRTVSINHYVHLWSAFKKHHQTQGHHMSEPSVLFSSYIHYNVHICYSRLLHTALSWHLWMKNLTDRQVIDEQVVKMYNLYEYLLLN